MDRDEWELTSESTAKKRGPRRSDCFRKAPIESLQPELIASRSIFDYLEPDSPVFWLSALREKLSLSLFAPTSSGGGYSYDPRMLLMLWILALWDGEGSSRRIERRLKTDIRYIVLSGGLEVDHSTLCRFRRRQDGFERLLARVVELAVEQGLVDLRRAHLDGTRLPGNVSQWRKLSQAAEASDAADGLGEEESGADEPKDRGTPGKRRRAFRDPDARTLATKRGYITGYNAQVLVDGQSGIALCGHVSSSSSDCALLEPTLQTCLEMYQELPDEVVADKGYDTPANARALQELGIVGYIPSHRKPFWKTGEDGAVLCPAGHEPTLTERFEVKGVTRIRQVVTQCRTCSRRPECGVITRKTIRVPEGCDSHTWIAMHERCGTEEGKRARGERAANVERYFAHAKWHLRFTRFSTYGLQNVRREWNLVLAATNLYRMWLECLYFTYLACLRRLWSPRAAILDLIPG